MALRPLVMKFCHMTQSSKYHDIFVEKYTRTLLNEVKTKKKLMTAAPKMSQSRSRDRLKHLFLVDPFTI